MERFIQPPLNTYFVSGIWTDDKGIPTHYCVHQFLNPGVSGMKKLSRDQLYSVLLRAGKYVYIFGWDYHKGCFVQGQEVQLIQGVSINTVPPCDNHRELKHLIKINWFEEMN